MSKIKPMIGGGQIWFCPGCNEPHHVNTTQRVYCRYNGDPDAPTFDPIVLVSWKNGDVAHRRVCHSFVRAGRIEFLNDCTHALAGQTVDMPKWSYAPGRYGGADEGKTPDA